MVEKTAHHPPNIPLVGIVGHKNRPNLCDAKSEERMKTIGSALLIGMEMDGRFGVGHSQNLPSTNSFASTAMGQMPSTNSFASTATGQMPSTNSFASTATGQMSSTNSFGGIATGQFLLVHYARLFISKHQ